MPAGTAYVAPAWSADSGEGRLGFEVDDVPAGDTSFYEFGIRDMAIHYGCPTDPMTTNGTAYIAISGDGGNLFIDAGDGNPTYTRVPSNGFQTGVPTASTGEALTISYQEGPTNRQGSLTTILFFSVGRPGLPGVNNGLCHVQGQIMDGAGPAGR